MSVQEPAIPFIRLVALTLVLSLCHTHQTLLGPHQRPVDPVHLVVEAAGVAQVVPGAVPAPQWCRQGSTVDTLPALTRKLLQEVRYCGDKKLVGWGLCPSGEPEGFCWALLYFYSVLYLTH